MNVISFIKSALQGGKGGAVPVADDQPLPTQMIDGSSGTAVSFGFTPFAQISTSTSVDAIKTGPGLIGDIQCFKSGSGDKVEIFDSLTATGTPIATIEGGTKGDKFCECWKFSVGLSIKTSGGTPGTWGGSYQ